MAIFRRVLSSTFCLGERNRGLLGRVLGALGYRLPDKNSLKSPELIAPMSLFVCICLSFVTELSIWCLLSRVPHFYSILSSELLYTCPLGNYCHLGTRFGLHFTFPSPRTHTRNRTRTCILAICVPSRKNVLSTERKSAACPAKGQRVYKLSAMPEKKKHYPFGCEWIRIFCACLHANKGKCH